MDSTNIFTQKPLVDWDEQYSLLLSKGAFSFAHIYPNPISFLIKGLSNEFGIQPKIGNLSCYESAFEAYLKGANLGDSLCCLRLSEIYSWKNNPFQVDTNKDKAWKYIILAQFYAINSPFGLETDISPLFDDFLTAVGDSSDIKNTQKFIQYSTDTLLIKHKKIINQVFENYFNSDLPAEKIVQKFQKVFIDNQENIDKTLIGIFILNVLSGNYKLDVEFLENNKVNDYFNQNIVCAFKLFNETFNVLGEAHAMVLTGVAVNILNFLQWKGKNYNGCIDECLSELIRTCMFIVDQNKTLVVSTDVQIIFSTILGACYGKGYFVKRNLRKALSYFAELNEDEVLDTNPNLMFDKMKLQEKLGMKNESQTLGKKLYNKYSTTDDPNTQGTINLGSFEYYLLGYLEEKIIKNEEKSKSYYQKGTEVVDGVNYRPFENLAYQRKCLKRLELLQREN